MNACVSGGEILALSNMQTEKGSLSAVWSMRRANGQYHCHCK
jgi:hypothetical protein